MRPARLAFFSQVPVFALLSLTSLIGCGSDVVESTTDASGTDDGATITKAEVDLAALDADGIEVALRGDVGSFEVPFAVALASGLSRDELGGALRQSVSLTVRSDTTGTTASLTDGQMVEGTPSGPGEYTWRAADDGAAVSFEFFNQTPVGTTVKVGRPYTGLFMISTNPYVDDVASQQVAVTVVAG